MTDYSTRNEAIDAIVAAIESSPEVRDARAEYNIDAIADEVVSAATDGGYQIVDHDDFWESVERQRREGDVAARAFTKPEVMAFINEIVDTINGDIDDDAVCGAMNLVVNALNWRLDNPDAGLDMEAACIANYGESYEHVADWIEEVL